MVHRIEIASTISDARAAVMGRSISRLGFVNFDDVKLVDVYTVDSDFSPGDLEMINDILVNPVTQDVVGSGEQYGSFDWAVEIGFLPGVTDNVGETTRQGIVDSLGESLPDDQRVYSSQLMLLSGDLSYDQVRDIAGRFFNPAIESVQIKSYTEFKLAGGMDVVVPRVRLDTQPSAGLVGILESDDSNLITIGKSGIANVDGSRRGPLALSLSDMKTIQDYFLGLGREPTDVELESLAQTWSEHCKHTIFANPMDDDVPGGLFNTFIRGATERIRKDKGDKDFCVSVFHDNSGGIVFDDDYLVSDKVETHNSPSALDPFGGAITGIVGVNRDTIGFGLGAKPVVNRYGFCFADPRVDRPLYKGAGFTQKMLPSRMIMDGVVDGVNVAGLPSSIASEEEVAP